MPFMTLMTPTLFEHFLRPRHIGDAGEPSFTGRAASLTCGANVRVSIQVDEEHRIVEAKFKAAGCSLLVAALSLITDRVAGKTISEAAIIARQPDLASSDLSRYEGSDCLSLAGDALIHALREFSDAAREDWLGNESLICTCFCVSEQSITQEILRKGLSSIAEVTRETNAGGGCGSCHPLIQELIEASIEDI